MKLVEYLKKNNINRSHMCRELGISRTHLNNIVKGHRQPSADLAKEIELFTGGSVNRLGLLYPEDYR